MQSSATDSYLQTQVLTASPQKLQLMLIDAALRWVQRGRQELGEGRYDTACEHVIRAQDVVTEMIGGLRADVNPPLVKRVASVYLYLFRSLTEANLHRDPARLDDVIRVLAVERETWRQVCEKLAGNGPGEASAKLAPPHAPAGQGGPAPETAAGLSLEA